LLGLGVVCVVTTSPLAASAVYTLNWVLMCLSLVAAVLVRGQQRFFWLGFAVFAWCYWYTDARSDGDYTVRRAPIIGGPWYAAMPEPTPPPHPARLLSSVFVDFLEARLHTRWSVGDAVRAQYSGGSYYPGVVDDVQNDRYLIRWTDGSSSPAQWTLPSQIQPGTSVVRVAATSLVSAVWGLIGGLLAIALFYEREASEGVRQG
jgi:hypothetical protein